MSNKNDFLRTSGISIQNNRNEYHSADLHSFDWSGILVGNDGYPTKDNDWYYISGDTKYGFFKPVAIEFYGVKTKT